MTTTHDVAPSDVERAALDLMVQVATQCGGAGFVALVQDLCGVLQLEGAFAGMSWADAKHVAAAAVVDAYSRDDAADFMRLRAELAESGGDGMTWDDDAAVARSLRIVARAVAQ
ncbi:hypothetical protein [Mycobacterium sp. P7213]|uniref:hypothetical protein n=1 Tax=Mycobacterium sp. P7213 TaxID=2478465 RepID=UPI000F62ABD9|nr:hypothetical protein [Mycobacterium sp. P7213]